MATREDYRRSEEVRQNSQNMSDSELRMNAANSMRNGNPADAAGYLKSLEDNRQRRNERYRNSGGGCFITTAVCDSFGKADDCYELKAFRNFRDKWLALQSDGKNLIAEYYNTAPKIVAKINRLPDAAKVYKNIWNDYLKNCLSLIERGENQKCKEIYVRMVNNLKSKFLG